MAGNNDLFAPPTKEEIAQSKLFSPPSDTELNAASDTKKPSNDTQKNASDSLDKQKELMKTSPALAGLYGAYGVNPYMNAVGVEQGAKYAKEHPAETGALVASAIFPAESLVGPAAEGAGFLAKTLNIGQKAGAAYGVAGAGGTAGSLASGKTLGDSLKEGNQQGSIYGAFSGAGNAIGEVAGPAFQKLGETQAFKAAGAMIKDFRSAYGKNTQKVNELGRTMLDNGLAGAGDSVSSIAKKSEALKRQTGQKIGKIYDKVLDAMTDPNVQMSPEMRLEIQASGFHPQAQSDEIKSLIAKKYKGVPGGTGAINKANQVIDEMAVNGNQIAPDHSLELKGHIDSMINWSKKSQDLPLEQEALKDVRNYIQNKLNDQVGMIDQVLNTSQSKELVKLNKLYGNVSTIANMSRDYMAREGAHSAMGMGGGLMALGGLAAGGAHGGMSEAGLLGVGALAGTKFLQKYGTAGIAGSSDMLASVLHSGVQSSAIPYQIGRISDPDNNISETPQDQNSILQGNIPANNNRSPNSGPSTIIKPSHKLKGK